MDQSLINLDDLEGLDRDPDNDDVLDMHALDRKILDGRLRGIVLA